jgi:hypothetical protein
MGRFDSGPECESWCCPHGSALFFAGPRSLATACAVIAGIEAVQMIRKGQVLRINKKNLQGQAWVFGSLLGLE